MKKKHLLNKKLTLAKDNLDMIRPCCGSTGNVAVQDYTAAITPGSDCTIKSFIS